ncbi:hypothetical protein HYU19_00370 [Candidatus Woesearchaeota archaeon]|nr:hypothetical protein [Candidatus Woesearchaeota archaeon]
MADDDITLRRGRTEVVVRGKLLDMLLSYPPFFNAAVLTIIFVLFFYLLDAVGFPIIFAATGHYWNINLVNGGIVLFLAVFLFFVARRYYEYWGAYP